MPTHLEDIRELAPETRLEIRAALDAAAREADDRRWAWDLGLVVPAMLPRPTGLPAGVRPGTRRLRPSAATPPVTAPTSPPLLPPADASSTSMPQPARRLAARAARAVTSAHHIPHLVRRLYAWQAEALAAWKARGRRGVVEAVTGTGKTMLGIAAAAEALAARQRVCILVPTIELQDQWVGALRATLRRGTQIGRLGGGHKRSLRHCDALVAVVNSARAFDVKAPDGAGLLIADECHHYGSDVNNRALDERFAWRLGLSATYARSDDGHLTWLEPYFGPPCFEMDYRRALAEEVTAHFKVALIGCRLPAHEAAAYKTLATEVSKLKRRLVEYHGVPQEPFGEFMKLVNTLAQGGRNDPDVTWTARKYLKVFQERKELLAETSAKLDTLGKLVGAVRAANRTIVFTHTIESAETVASELRRGSIRASAIHSSRTRQNRSHVLADFSIGHLTTVVAPQVLDEGVDVPEADLAIIVAASRTRRQIIQRMGRVLRRKADGRLARFAVLYVEDTSEDPALGAHEDFLHEITSVADHCRDFDADAQAAQICSYLNDATPLHAPRPPRWAAEAERL